MNVYTCVDHACHWPVGVASVVVAEDIEQARQLLDAALAEHGLDGSEKSPYTLTPVSLATPAAYVLADGNY